MRTILLALSLALPVLPALAADVAGGATVTGAPVTSIPAEARIDGKWISRDSSGNGMIVEFSPKSVTITPVDAKGTPVDDSVTDDVTYDEKNGAITATLPQGDIMVAAFKNPATIFVVIPGLPTTEFARIK